MGKIKGLEKKTDNQNKVRLKVNLKEFFGTDKLPRDDSFRSAVGQAIIDTILQRTSNSEFLNKNAPKEYSEAYSNSLDFDAAGKSKNKVNLRLTGDMLDLLDIVEIKGNNLEIGWSDADENNKAHGHITGGGNLPKRDFFGLKGEEADEIRSEFKSALKDFHNEEKKKFRAKVEALLLKFKPELEDGEES